MLLVNQAFSRSMSRNILIGAALLSGAGFYAFKLKEAGDSLELEPSVQVHKVTFTNATLKVRVTAYNKGKVGLRLDNLKVDLAAPDVGGQQSIIYTSSKTAPVTIPAGGSQTFTLTLLTMPFIQLARLIGAVKLAQLRDQGLNLLIKSSAKVNYVIPYSSEDPITLKLR